MHIDTFIYVYVYVYMYLHMYVYMYLYDGLNKTSTHRLMYFNGFQLVVSLERPSV